MLWLVIVILFLGFWGFCGYWTIIGIAIPIILIAIYFAYRVLLTKVDFDLGDLEGLGKSFEQWSQEEFPNTGRLPMSTKISGVFARWHNPDFYRTGDDFWKTFQDGPWKWEDQQRYAGKALNCGHYFSISVPGSRAEAGYYELDLTKYQLLRVVAAFEAILDLTYEENLREMAKLAFPWYLG
jgi:hypothetical protein